MCEGVNEREECCEVNGEVREGLGEGDELAVGCESDKAPRDLREKRETVFFPFLTSSSEDGRKYGIREESLAAEGDEDSFRGLSAGFGADRKMAEGGCCGGTKDGETAQEGLSREAADEKANVSEVCDC